jgi:hypothetical protein
MRHSPVHLLGQCDLMFSVSNISSNVCTYPSALETKVSATYSPATPTTISSQPKNADNFTRLGVCSSGREKWNLRLKRQCRTIEDISCHSSGPSNTSPATTSPVAANNQLKHASRNVMNSARMRSSMPLRVSGLRIGGGTIMWFWRRSKNRLANDISQFIDFGMTTV